MYDAFGRLVAIHETGTTDALTEYEYNGLGYRTGWHYDLDEDGDVDSSDEWYRHVYDTRWRIVGTYREPDSDPKEQWVYHGAGLGGQGEGSYVDAIALREKEANTAWDSASDGTLEERLYYSQNRRHDVVALVESAGVLVEQVRYSPYGVPFGLPAADADSDGDVDAGDVTLINSGGAYDVRRDPDLDGDVDAADAAIGTALKGTALGLAASSRVGQRRGLSGHEGESSARSLLHARHRVLDTGLGRWMTRDPLGSINGPSMFAFVRGNSHKHRDAEFTLPGIPVFHGAYPWLYCAGIYKSEFGECERRYEQFRDPPLPSDFPDDLDQYERAIDESYRGEEPGFDMAGCLECAKTIAGDNYATLALGEYLCGVAKQCAEQYRGGRSVDGEGCDCLPILRAAMMRLITDPTGPGRLPEVLTTDILAMGACAMAYGADACNAREKYFTRQEEGLEAFIQCTEAAERRFIACLNGREWQK